MHDFAERSSESLAGTASPSWRKSQHSNPNGACAELAALSGGSVAMRNSRHPDGAVLIYTAGSASARSRPGRGGRGSRMLSFTRAAPNITQSSVHTRAARPEYPPAPALFRLAVRPGGRPRW